LFNVEKVLIYQKQTQLYPKNAWGRHRSERKDFRNSARGLYWRPV